MFASKILFMKDSVSDTHAMCVSAIHISSYKTI